MVSARLTAAMLGILVIYLTGIGLQFFGMQVPLLNDSNPMAFSVSVIICFINSLNFIPDFDIIELGESEYAQKVYGIMRLTSTTRLRN